MTSKNNYHYVYRITNKNENKHYYGKRSSNLHPLFDLGIKYFSSSRDGDFIKNQKVNPEFFKYKIIKIFDNLQDALDLEIKLHLKFRVGKHSAFYNIVTQTHSKFDSTGKFPSISTSGKTELITKDDPRYISGELKGMHTGRPCSQAAKNKTIELQIGKYGKLAKGFKQYYVTPVGVYDIAFGLEPKIHRKILIRICTSYNNKLVTKIIFNKIKHILRYDLFDDVRGKTYADIGFGIILKDNYLSTIMT